MDNSQDPKNKLKSEKLTIGYLHKKVFALEKDQKDLLEKIEILSDIANKSVYLENNVARMKIEIATLRKTVELLKRYHEPL
jgi:hypothetical protein